MAEESKTSYISEFIREVCKGRSKAELQEAEHNFREYLLVLKEICDRLERKGKTLTDFDDESNL